MKITSSITHVSKGVPLSDLDKGDIFQIHKGDTFCKYLILRKTRLQKTFSPKEPPTTGRCLIALYWEDQEENDLDSRDHDWKIFQGSDLDLNVYRVGRVKTLNIKMEME